MNLNQLYPSNYLKAEDLQGREVTVTIDRVVVEKLGQDEKPIMYFQGKQKGVVLNKTNATNIGSVYGSETTAWTGKKVTLFPAWVDFQGKSVQAIRIRPAFDGQAQQPVQQPQAAPQPMPPTQSMGTSMPSDQIPF